MSLHNTVESILFVCWGNTCRSVLAEHLARRNLTQVKRIESAGVHPGNASQAENALHTLRTFGFEVASHDPRSVRNVDVSQFDLVITLAENVATEFAHLCPDVQAISWKIHDPYGYQHEYEPCALEIVKELNKLKKKLGQSEV